QHTRFIELAGEINTEMPSGLCIGLGKHLTAVKRPLMAQKLLIVGLAYKPSLDDERESPSYALMELLSQRRATVEYFYPYVPVIKPSCEHGRFGGQKSVDWNASVLQASTSF